MKILFKGSSTLMNRLAACFFTIIVIMFALNSFSIYGFRSSYSSLYSLIEKINETHSMSTQVDMLYDDVNNYIHGGNMTYIKDYKDRLKDLEETIQTSIYGCSDSEYYQYRDIYNVLLTFDEQSTKIIVGYDAGILPIYLKQSSEELLKLSGFLQDNIKNLLHIKLSDTLGYYVGFAGKMRTAQELLYILIALTMIFCMIFAYRFSRKISVPIHQLVIRLRKVAQGNLDVEQVRIKTGSEIDILIDSFNQMIVQIRNLIEGIKEKAIVESKLKEQEIKNLEIANLLHKSELMFLQAQINPHFLFNTMNSIAALADIEEAPQTKKMLESMSDILRYNLKKMNEKVTLKEEFKIIENYIYIQRIRFGKRIQYSLRIDDEALQYKVPSMILQPFVENSIIHGLEPKEGESLLELCIYNRDEIIEIFIKDNGVGMTQEKINSFFSKDNIETTNTEKGGIGVSNVINRLEITYGRKVIDIKSSLGVGTVVRITVDKSYD